jgi:hypothetical protein
MCRVPNPAGAPDGQYRPAHGIVRQAGRVVASEIQPDRATRRVRALALGGVGQGSGAGSANGQCLWIRTTTGLRLEAVAKTDSLFTDHTARRLFVLGTYGWIRSAISTSKVLAVPYARISPRRIRRRIVSGLMCRIAAA